MAAPGPPGSYGIEGLKTEVEKLARRVGEVVTSINKVTAALLMLTEKVTEHHQQTNHALQGIQHSLKGLEGVVNTLATRAELDAAKAALGQAIADAANRVTTDIQALRDQIANGQPVTDADLVDIQNDIQQLGQIDPVVPPPTP